MDNIQQYALTVVLFSLAIFSSIIGVNVYAMVTPAEATGCPVDTIIPFLQDAKTSLDKGDVETAKSQLEEGINQLQDTFEVEK